MMIEMSIPSRALIIAVMVLASFALAGCGKSGKDIAVTQGAAGSVDQLRERIASQRDR